MKNTSLNFLDQLKCGFFFLKLTAKATKCLLTTAYLSFHRIRSKGDWCRGPTCSPLSTQGGLLRLSAAPGGPRSRRICISLCVNRVVQSSTWDWQEARLNKGTAQKVRTTLCRESEPLMPRPSVFHALVSGSCSGAAGSFRPLLGWPWIPSHVMPWLCGLLRPQALTSSHGCQWLQAGGILLGRRGNCTVPPDFSCCLWGQQELMLLS